MRLFREGAHALARAGLLAACALAMQGCSGERGSDSPAITPEALAELARFPSPPASRSLGVMDEPGAHLNLPTGPADEDGNVPVRHAQGRVFRRVSLMSTGSEIGALVAHYRERFDHDGYTVVFECEGVEGCGGTRFVTEVIEAYVTAPGNVTRARSVMTLTQPTSGELRHFSLERERDGVAERVGITLTRSEDGPLVVVTQQAFSPLPRD